MSEAIRLLLVDALPESRQLINTMLSFDPHITLVSQVSTVPEAIVALERHSVDLVIVSDTIGTGQVPKAVWQLSGRVRGIGIIVMGSQNEPEILRRAMLAGARGFTNRPVDGRELRQTVRDVFARMREEREDRDSRLVKPTSPLVLRRSGTLGHVVAVFGAKGGVGKTTLSVNLSVSLRQITGHSVAMVDADLTFGDAGLFLDLAPVHTLIDVIEALDRNVGEGAMDDAELLKGYFARYDPLGLRVLLGPTRPEHANLIKTEHLRRLFTVLPRLFDYVVVDCPVAYDERVLTMLDFSDQILFLVTPEVGPLKNARHFIDMCETMGYTRERVQVVLNRAGTQVSITAEDVQRWLAYPVTFEIQSGGAKVPEAANRGVPLALQDPRNPVSADIGIIANAVIRAADKTRQSKSTDTLRWTPS